ncbi:unnamed protein product (macronuclear) [Paramecium tetraurelia]|uniref:Autophagy-related protein n=1 Tax=Paramecium tetraurelia TaxID=5888 RepID=A0CES2_PARTE|nr:uncharacterized protein GSPATT00037728001 [Paramecium tetraurelia]CAK69289.1 unnamed protein product [Paramecium tetraurelia]|eukprot:XP_001436686.1 hypothetical protein (macronuclear) [Paramecium tetraurelia strain d4-2]
MQTSLTYSLGLKNDSNYQFLTKHTLAKRKELSDKYNNGQQVAVICEPHRLYRQAWAGAGPQLPTLVCVFSKKDPVSSIFQTLKAKLKINQETTLYLLCNNYILQYEQSIGQVYDKYKNHDDGLLYIKYSSQETFGN